MSANRKFWTAVAGLALIAACLRIMFVAYVSPPLKPMQDARSYYLMGKHLAAGEGFVRWDPRRSDPTIPTSAYPPLYPAMLAVLQLAGVTSIETQRFVVGVLGAVNVPLLAALGRACAGPTVGLIAAALAVVAPGLLEIDGAYMSESLYVPLVILTLLMVLRATERGTPSAWAIAGALSGLAALARSEALMMFMLLLIPLSLLTASRHRRFIQLISASIAIVAVVGPWTIRNALTLDAFVPVSQNHKGAILGANCREIYDSPKYRGTWSFNCVHRFDWTGMSEAEIFDKGLDTGLRFALENRGQLPEVVTARLMRTWGLYDPAKWKGHTESEVRSSQFQTRAWWLGWMFLAMAPIGLVTLARQSKIRFWILAAPIAMACVSSVIGYGNTRFRAVAEPSLVVLAAIVLARTPIGKQDRLIVASRSRPNDGRP